MSRARPARRRRLSTAARLRPFWVLIALAVALGGGAVAYAVAWPGFYPSAVRVSGNHAVGADEIVASAGVLGHVNVWLQNTAAMQKRIEALPDILTARVHRIPPAVVAIDVVERTPFARVRSGTATATIDNDLRVLSPGTPAPALPEFAVSPGLSLVPGSFLTDPHVRRLHAVYTALDAAHVAVLRLGFDRFGGVIATLPDGVAVLLGEQEPLASTVGLIAPILAQGARQPRAIKALDLRAPNTPVIVYRSAQ